MKRLRSFFYCCSVVSLFLIITASSLWATHNFLDLTQKDNKISSCYLRTHTKSIKDNVGKIISIAQKDYPALSSEYDMDKIENIFEEISKKFSKEYSEIYDYFEILVLNFLDEKEIYDMIGVSYPKVVHEHHIIRSYAYDVFLSYLFSLRKLSCYRRLLKKALRLLMNR